MTRPHAILGLLLLAACAVTPGCAGASADERIELDADTLPPSAGTDDSGVFQSVAWSGDDWHRYPGDATLVVHHDLGRAPRSVLTYLAFTPSGAGSGLAAGDLARVLEVTESTVTIRNDTNGDFFCRLVLQ